MDNYNFINRNGILNSSQTGLYNTGLIINDNVLRMKQGLLPQNLASICESPPYGSLYKIPPIGTCNNTNLYPFPATQYNYGQKQIPNSCSCTTYVQPP
jgi:hypothetical protein